MHTTHRLAFLVAAAAALTTAQPVSAAFHLMKIVEVFPGSAIAPDAHYVVLQMYSSGQNFVSGHSVVVSDADGETIGSASFASSVADGANQSKILIATAAAQTFFGVTADLVMQPILPLAGGKVCFDAIDCVAWGDYEPAAPDALVGTPFNSAAEPVPAQPALGLVAGKAIQRRLDIAGSAGALDALDDTDDSAHDFVLATPAPRNNAGQNGTIPPATCGNGALEGLEECDDGDTFSDDGCSSTCQIEFCGDLVVNDGDETCDAPAAAVCSDVCQLREGLETATWIDAETGYTNDLDFTVTGLASPTTFSIDLGAGSYAAAPGGVNEDAILLGPGDDWTVGVDPPAAVLLVYASDWRGQGAGVNPVTYEFDRPFTIASGLESASVDTESRRLVLPASDFHDGILLFEGPLTSLSVQANATAGFHGMTFAGAVPEPAAAPLGALAALLALRRSRRRYPRPLM